MITFGRDEHKENLIAMWKLCFPSDSDESIAFYFNHIYRSDETLILSNESIPAASLQMIPYRIKIGRTIHDAAYISGAMTHPTFRRRGYMEQLLAAAFDEMKKKEFSASFLIPQEEWLFEFYKKYGYQKAFLRNLPETIILPQLSSEYTEEKGTVINIYTQFTAVDADELYPVYFRFLLQKENAVLKKPHQFSHILQDFFIDNGTLFANEEGIAFTFFKEGKIFLKEFFYTGIQSQKHFFNFIANHFSTTQLVVSPTGITSQSRFRGMIKVLDPTFLLPDNIYMSMMLD